MARSCCGFCRWYGRLTLKTKVAARKTHRYSAIHTAAVMLTRPELARTRGSCQQKTVTNAEVIAPPSKIFSFISFLSCLNLLLDGIVRH